MSAVAAPPIPQLVPPLPAPPQAPPPAAAPTATPDDLLRLPDEGRGYELVDGQLQERSMSFLSSYVAGEAYAALREYVRPRSLGWVVPEGTSFRCFPDDPTRVRRADSAFIALDRFTTAQATAEGFCTVCPDLVVEVVSPHNLASELNRKVEEWLRAGAKLVWVIDPDPRLAFAHRPDGVEVRREADALAGDPVLPGFRVLLADLFRLPASLPARSASGGS